MKKWTLHTSLLLAALLVLKLKLNLNLVLYIFLVPLWKRTKFKAF